MREPKDVMTFCCKHVDIDGSRCGAVDNETRTDEFEQYYDGEDWVFDIARVGDVTDTEMKCCRCGLVHKIEVERKRGAVVLRLWVVNGDEEKDNAEAGESDCSGGRLDKGVESGSES
jgi:hypothetical protein